MLYNNILETIGNTPIIKINKIGPKNQHIYAKCESFNPLSSVKDRLAIAIITEAEKSGTLKPGQTVIEATSGNTGIALAMVCAAKGYPFVATMVETFSIERRRIMKALGAKVILTPAAERGSGMVRRAEELAKEHNWFLASQFENPANPEYHRNTTAPEILRDFAGHALDYFVSGWGTGGTITGTGEVLKAARPEIKIIGTEPENANLLGGAEWQPHKIQGCTPDFIPKDLKDFGLIPEILGRLPVLTYMNPLDESTLRAILTEPKNAIVKQYKKLFEMDEISLSFEDDALDFIVKKAIDYKLGARGLRSLCEEILTDAMFVMPSSDDTALVVNKAYAQKHLTRTELKRLKAVS